MATDHDAVKILHLEVWLQETGDRNRDTGFCMCTGGEHGGSMVDCKG